MIVWLPVLIIAAVVILIIYLACSSADDDLAPHIGTRRGVINARRGNKDGRADTDA